MSGCWPEWYRRARVELERGVREVPGPGDDPRVVQYLESVPEDHLADPWRRNDETPWCAAFVTWCVTGYGDRDDEDVPRWPAPPFAARARSWLRRGTPIEEPPEGAIVILARGSGPQPGPETIDAPGHVGFLADRYADELLLLGGNQGDRVSLRAYPISRLLGFRWAAT